MNYWLLLIPLCMAVAIVIVLSLLGIMARRIDNDRSKQHIEDVLKASPYRKKEQQIRPHNEPLARNKVYEKLKEEELEYGVVQYDPHNLEKQEEHQNETKIVGIVEPKGFWSRFIMSQKLGYIMARLSFQKSSNTGFWVNLIKAQQASQGKDQAKGR